MNNLPQLAADRRVTVRRAGIPDPEANCVLYWMQRKQRGDGTAALDVAIEAAKLTASFARDGLQSTR
jgi:deoxyribodipyrimidine photo-lyase